MFYKSNFGKPFYPETKNDFYFTKQKKQKTVFRPLPGHKSAKNEQKNVKKCDFLLFSIYQYNFLLNLTITIDNMAKPPGEVKYLTLGYLKLGGFIYSSVRPCDR